MAKAGYCAECGTNTWVNEDGTCAQGHAASGVSGVYEVEPQAPASEAKRDRSPWAIVGLVLLVLLPVGLLVCGILVAIAIPVFDSASDSARQRACFSNQRVIEGSVQQYLANDPDVEIGDLAGPVEDGTALVPGYIREVPTCLAAEGSPYVVDRDGTTTCPAGDEPTGHGRYTSEP